jgi:hypothetical protein
MVEAWAAFGTKRHSTAAQGNGSPPLSFRRRNETTVRTMARVLRVIYRGRCWLPKGGRGTGTT